ncbi:hypothetical protein Q73_11925 [Bacillus coahuilensis m2-6]|uniref:Uncharacterized protein n=1 Tax=Bacillus coahuilensis p1.1.43 TaxID=1150625 RepID=A0A147K677_9BACI|nr:VPLPA-CTERM sorting domain-containing protein [Bacillus coahuilensis]KUP05342.1 hypothetical protein Q75_12520 [Bacillus coahuilensis p1.1.43]KUP06085.1 hypothetical protein Q73_11925 [Bacillus coahuilensis m2-6]
MLFYSYIVGLFLYFPEDKSEYLPAAIWLLIFGLAAYGTFRFVGKISKKQEQEAKELEHKLKEENDRVK